MIPARLALALQADGWWLRSEIVWHKPNPMPESVTDRPTKAHEMVYLLTKSADYFYDAEAVRESGADNRNGASGDRNMAYHVALGRRIESSTLAVGPKTSGRNLRSIWTIATEAFPGAHFATYPRALVGRCIKAGTSERGCCPRCGGPWAREVEREVLANGRGRDHIAGGDRTVGQGWEGVPRASLRTSTLGFRPSCACPAHDPVPCVVLDPFAGSATTLVVAEALGRHPIGVELGPEYLDIARRRLERPHAAIPRPGRVESMPLFGE